MQIVKTFLFIVITLILHSCQNGKDFGNADKGKIISDTLIYSSPSNYELIMDNVGESKKIEIRDYKDMFALFEKLNYTPEAWQSGIREVPRVYLPIIGEKWGPTNSKEVTVENKKTAIFSWIGTFGIAFKRTDFDRPGSIGDYKKFI